MPFIKNGDLKLSVAQNSRSEATFKMILFLREESSLNLEVHPVTQKKWSDFETLFGAKGACGGCWCMLWRLTRKEFEQQKGEANRQAMQTIVESGEIPGLLAYSEKQPVAWCSVAPRKNFPALERSRVLKKIDFQLWHSLFHLR